MYIQIKQTACELIMSAIFAERALLPEGWARNVR
ncbi:hypothetical protein ACVSMD_39960, partial [Pseudomonas aeruginosa]